MNIKNDIQTRLDYFIELKRQVQPYHTNRASEIGHPCIRYLYYCRVYWHKRTQNSKSAQSVYLENIEQESSIIRLLLGLGFRIYDQGRSYSLSEFTIKGKICGIISNNEFEKGIEIKCIDKTYFNEIGNGLSKSDEMWKHKLEIQVNLYMAMTHRSDWLVILKNKNALELKFIEFNFDIDVYNKTIEKAMAINEAIKAVKLPDSNVRLYCELCPFKDICKEDEMNIKKSDIMRGE